MTPPPNKSSLRSQLKQTLRQVSQADRACLSHLAAARLLASPEYRNARTLMLFVSLPSEIDTTPIALDAFGTSRRVLVPRTNLADHSMLAIQIADLHSGLAPTPIGVQEPAAGLVIPPDQIDLVLVPGLAFGPAGERLGRGAGFYDRFLAHPQLRAIRCGLAYELQLTPNIPMSPLDVPLHMLITDQYLRHFPLP